MTLIAAPALDALTAALAEPDPRSAPAALAALVAATVGARLVTLMRLDPETGESTRILSSHPDVYPLGGRKPLPQNDWTRLVIDARQTFVANTPEAVARVLFDHEVIASLGCGACLNLPLVAAGRVVGTLNLLDAAGFFTPERVAAAERLALPALAVVLSGLLAESHAPAQTAH